MGKVLISHFTNPTSIPGTPTAYWGGKTLPNPPKKIEDWKILDIWWFKLMRWISCVNKEQNTKHRKVALVEKLMLRLRYCHFWISTTVPSLLMSDKYVLYEGTARPSLEIDELSGTPMNLDQRLWQCSIKDWALWS